jgi:flagellar M-ring protein FliF
MEATPSESKSLVPGEAPPLPPATTHENLPPLVRGWMQMPRGRQIGLIAALALTLAVAIAMMLWAKQPEYAMLFGNMPEKQAGEITQALDKLNIEHQLDAVTGSIRVPADQVHALRLKLAEMGLPKESSVGFELLDKENGFGVSQLVEGARYQRALEGEIARSIMTINGVKAARVHLALPKESVFVRQPKRTSASVLVDMLPGRALAPGQVDAIKRLVAYSIPQLEPDQVTVADQSGYTLIDSAQKAQSEALENEFNLTDKQFQYKRQVEEHLIERVENLLMPVTGANGVRTQVSADVDFTVTERTQEVYNPDAPALRSEQSREEQTKGAGPQGVPGALTNQPPPAGVAPELAGQPPNPAGQNAAPGGQTGQALQQQEGQSTVNKSATRNYELDRTISHSRLGTGVVRRVTAAVVMDNKRILQADGTITTQPYTEEELGRFTNLVKEAVGYDPTRGDRVTVSNAAFHPEEAAPPPPPVWEQPWFVPLLKYAATGLVLLVLILGVLRPMVRGLTGQAQREAEEKAAAKAAAEAAAVASAAAAAGGVPGAPGSVPALTEGGEAREGVLAGPEGEGAGEDAENLEFSEDMLMLEAPQNYEKRLEFVQKAIDQDSKRVAQVIKNWMGTNV